MLASNKRVNRIQPPSMMTKAMKHSINKSDGYGAYKHPNDGIVSETAQDVHGDRGDMEENVPRQEKANSTRERDDRYAGIREWHQRTSEATANESDTGSILGTFHTTESTGSSSRRRRRRHHRRHRNPESQSSRPEGFMSSSSLGYESRHSSRRSRRHAT
jgi:hypothetical protein